jgi:hypothetical protein
MSTNGTSISLFSGVAKGVMVNANGSNNSFFSCGVEGGAVVVALMYLGEQFPQSTAVNSVR